LILSLTIMYLSFPFYFKGINLIQAAALYGGCFMYVVVYYKRLFRGESITRAYWSFASYICFLMVILFILSVLVSVLHGTYDFTFSLQIISTIRYGVLYICVYLILCRHCPKNEMALFYFIRAVALYVCFSIVLLIPQLRQMWMDVLYIKNEKKMY